MRTITSFSHHRVVRRHTSPTQQAAPTRTARFTRDRARDPFESFWQAYPSRSPHSNPRKPARARFESAVRRGVDPADILRGARNYASYVADNVRDAKYVMQAVTWLNREQWVDYGQPAPRATSTSGATLNGSAVARMAIDADMLARTRALGPGLAVSDADLAARLADFYAEVRRERDAERSTIGPVDLLHRYVAWLGERGWPTMTTRVLSASSPAFQQFRRELAALHPRGADPLTGR